MKELILRAGLGAAFLVLAWALVALVSLFIGYFLMTWGPHD